MHKLPINHPGGLHVKRQLLERDLMGVLTGSIVMLESTPQKFNELEPVLKKEDSKSPP